MNELALFAGAGGGILGGRLLGWRTVCAVELDRYARDVLIARQDDGCLEPFPVWDDITTFDGRPWAGLVDVVSGGFPCQDISTAGKGQGITGAKSGLWSEMARVIGEVRPRYILVENSPMLTSRGLGTVLGDLAAMGFDAEWGVLGAHNAGAPHKRDRIWIVGADRDRWRREVVGQPEHGHLESPCRRQPNGLGKGRRGDGSSDAADPDCDAVRDAEQREARRRDDLPDGGLAEPRHDGPEGPVADSDRAGRCEQWWTIPARAKHQALERGGWWRSEPDVGRVVDGVAPVLDRNARLRAIGNGQVPIVAASAWEMLMGRLEAR